MHKVPFHLASALAAGAIGVVAAGAAADDTISAQGGEPRAKAANISYATGSVVIADLLAQAPEPDFAVGPARYLVGRPTADQVVAYDTVDRVRYTFAKTGLANGRYRLSRQGSIRVRDGVITNVSENAVSAGYTLEKRGDTIMLTKRRHPDWRMAISPSGVEPAEHFAVMDLEDGTLLFVDATGVHALSLTLEDRDVANGTPNFNQFEDFAP